jgi:DNA repair protein RadC
MSVSADRRILGCESISTGTVNNAGITPRAVLSVAIKNKARSVILAHNHPSGIPEPSVDDKTLTVALSHVLETSSIKLRAHYVVAGNSCEPVMENMNF